MALVVAETVTAARPGLLDIDELGALEQQGQHRGRRVWGRLMDLMLAPQAAEDPRPQRCATCGGRLAAVSVPAAGTGWSGTIPCPGAPD